MAEPVGEYRKTVELGSEDIEVVVWLWRTYDLLYVLRWRDEPFETDVRYVCGASIEPEAAERIKGYVGSGDREEADVLAVAYAVFGHESQPSRIFGVSGSCFADAFMLKVVPAESPNDLRLLLESEARR